MRSICGADCQTCPMNESCNGCEKSGGCPFGKECFIARYVKTGGMENFLAFKRQLLAEFNGLQIEGMPAITELFALRGEFVNLAYPMPSGYEMQLLDDDEIYLGAQVESTFGGDRCFGVVAGMGFLLVCEYGVGGANPEIVLFKRR